MTSAAAVPSIGLNDENTIPVLGIGVGELTDDEAERAVSAALEIGVRLIDTAAAYGNEAGVGRAIAASGIPRAEIFLTTKLATQDQGFQASQDAAKVSLDRLGVDYLDLYLIHWPGGDTGKYVDSWGGLLRVREDKLATSIGVANFTPDDLTNIIEAYSPLGVGKLLDNPTVTAVAAQYGKTPAQVLIRWNLQLGNVVIPRSAKPERIAENFDVLDFELAEEHLAALTGLDDGTRYRPDPATYTGT